MSWLRGVSSGLRLGLFQALGGAARRLEPRRDPGYMTRQLERGAIVWRAFLDAGTALRRAGRFEEADAMVARGLSVFPGDPALLNEHAFSAHESGRYELAITRWEAALAASPDEAMNHAGLAANLRETGSHDRAATIVTAALARFPQDLTVLTEAARVADARLEFARSLPLWRKAADRPNPPPEWMQGEAHALLRLGRFDEAASVVARSRAFYPVAPGLMAVEALLASERHDWSKAVPLWAAYRQRFPDDEVGRIHLDHASAAEAADARNAVVVDDPDVRALLHQFESLGETGEFWHVRRRFGAQPSDRPRWSGVTLDGLVTALGARFDGFGTREHTDLAGATDETVVVEDRRWHLRLQCRRPGGTDILRPLCAALAELRESLLTDLAEARKVFVYCSAGLDPDGLDRLHRALGQYGPVRLLFVRPAAPTAPTLLQGAAGDLVEVEPRRYVGFLERLGLDKHGLWDIAYDDWIAICREAAALPH